MDKTLIGERIKAIRKLHKMTQKELGEKIGLSQTAISMIEKGELSISLDSLYKFCSLLEIPITKILDVQSDPPEDDLVKITGLVRSLDPKQRQLLILLLETFVANCAKEG